MCKKIVISVVLLLMLSCGGGEDLLKQTLYHSDFLIENNASYTVEVQYEPFIAVTSDLVSRKIPAGQTAEFHSVLEVADSLADVATPVSAFARLLLFAVDEPKKYPGVDKLKDELWRRENTAQQGVSFTLELQDSDFVYY